MGDKKRIDSIDLLKGIAMAIIVWKHTVHPLCLDVVSISALFFLLSGIFFRNEPFILFFKKRVRTILIPFVAFYTLSCLFRIATYGAQHLSLQGFQWTTLLDLFTISDTSNYLSVNIPLWFLVCLFAMQLLFWTFNRLIPQQHRAIGLLLLLIGLYIAHPYIIYWETPFMLNTALECLPFFIFGNLFGLPIARYLTDTRYRYLWAIASLGLFIALQYLPYDWGIIPLAETLLIYVCLIALLSSISNGTNLFCRAIRHIGTSTLLILGTHALVLSVVQTTTYAICGENLLSGIICLLLTLTIIALITPLFDRYLPWMVGKKKV